MVKKIEKEKTTPKIAFQPPKNQVQKERDEKMEYAKSVFFECKKATYQE
jgi:hypothetical protein